MSGYHVRNDVLVVLRVLRGWSQGELAAAAGVAPDNISKYERGTTATPPELLERLVTAMGYPGQMVERTAAFARMALKMRDAGAGGQPGESIEAAVAALAAEMGWSWEGTVREKVTRVLEEAEILDARRRARALWARLRPYPHEARLALVREGEELSGWALAELLCERSVEAAADDAGAAVEVAELAVAVAERARGRRPTPREAQGYAWGFLGNARRVRGEFEAAERAFARSAELWPQLPACDGCPLDGNRLLALEASLRREQRRFEDAFALLDRAMARKPAPRTAASLLLVRAKTHEALGQYGAATEALREAAGRIDSRSEPRLAFVVRQNLASNLCLAERPIEAQAMLGELRRLGETLGNRLDLVRVRWLEGRVAAGLRRFDEAIEAFRQVGERLAAQQLRFDAALVAVELAEVLAAEGRTEEVKSVARQSAAVLKSKGFPAEAAKALQLFRDAAETERLTAGMAHRVAVFLYRARHDSALAFEAAA